MTDKCWRWSDSPLTWGPDVISKKWAEGRVTRVKVVPA